jgi:two-component system response regulator FixJ
MYDGRHLVLILDGDAAVRAALQFALQLEGFNVHTHSGGAELLADPDLSRAGCIILDDQTPLMEGFQLMSQLRSRNIRLPAILLTSHATAGLRARANAAGIRLVLEKPLLDNTLSISVLTVLNSES